MYLRLRRSSTAIVLAALLVAPIASAMPASAAGPSSRAECRLMDPGNLTDFCRKLYEIDVWRQQVMDDTGATPTIRAQVPLPPPPPLPEVSEVM
jgi:Spy/CpxP family protein refolding chaperone